MAQDSLQRRVVADKVAAAQQRLKAAETYRDRLQDPKSQEFKDLRAAQLRARDEAQAERPQQERTTSADNSAEEHASASRWSAFNYGVDKAEVAMDPIIQASEEVTAAKAELAVAEREQQAIGKPDGFWTRVGQRFSNLVNGKGFRSDEEVTRRQGPTKVAQGEADMSEEAQSRRQELAAQSEAAQRPSEPTPEYEAQMAARLDGQLQDLQELQPLQETDYNAVKADLDAAYAASDDPDMQRPGAEQVIEEITARNEANAGIAQANEAVSQANAGIAQANAELIQGAELADVQAGFDQWDADPIGNSYGELPVWAWTEDLDQNALAPNPEVAREAFEREEALKDQRYDNLQSRLDAGKEISAQDEGWMKGRRDELEMREAHLDHSMTVAPTEDGSVYQSEEPATYEPTY